MRLNVGQFSRADGECRHVRWVNLSEQKWLNSRERYRVSLWVTPKRSFGGDHVGAGGAVFRAVLQLREVATNESS